MNNRSPRASSSLQSGITATVKWFNASKGFGFVAPQDGSSDAFLHISVLQRVGRQSISQGAVIVVDLEQGPKGPQVSTILSVESEGSDEGGYGGGAGARDSFGGGRDSYGGGRDSYGGGRDSYGGGRDSYGGGRDSYGGGRDSYGGGGYASPSGGGYGGGASNGGDVTMDGVVKFFSAEKGFGFVTPDGGGKDVFIGIGSVTRSGLQNLESGQRVRINTREGKKGPMAEAVELI